MDNLDANDAVLYGLRIDATQDYGNAAMKLPSVDDAATPTLTIGAGGDGIYQAGASSLDFSIDGTSEITINQLGIRGTLANSGQLMNETVSTTNPTIVPDNTDVASGMGAGASGEVSIIANSVEMARFDESGSGDAQIILASGSIGPAEVVAALKTDSLSFNIFGVTTADDGAQWEAPSAVTITQIDCSTDAGTVDIQFDERVLTTPTTGGTNVMAAALVCDTNNQQQTSFDNAEIAADALLNMDVDAVSGAGQVRVHVRYTID
jgi:hypothetical protein